MTKIKQLLHPEEIHFMRANWMQNVTEIGVFCNVLVKIKIFCSYFDLKSMKILQNLMFLRVLRADVKVQ